MSDDIRAEITNAAKALCHYPSGPGAANSCCPAIGRCEMDAAITEIARLRAALATARLEGMEEAAKIADRCTPRGHEGYDGAYNRGINTGTMQAKADIAAAIRAAAKEDKP